MSGIDSTPEESAWGEQLVNFFKPDPEDRGNLKISLKTPIDTMETMDSLSCALLEYYRKQFDGDIPDANLQRYLLDLQSIVGDLCEYMTDPGDYG